MPEADQVHEKTLIDLVFKTAHEVRQALLPFTFCSASVFLETRSCFAPRLPSAVTASTGHHVCLPLTS